MATVPLQFKELARRNAADEQLGRVIRKATSHSLNKRAEVVAEMPKWEEIRRRGHDIRRRSIGNLDMYLERFELRCHERGTELLWARDAGEACSQVIEILRQSNAKHIVKSKSMVTEEIELNHFLAENGFDVVETDLGEYIIQLAGEKPSHITAPAIHKSKEEIGSLFSEKLKIPYTSDPSELTRYARRLLRKKFIEADVGITGANFLVAESGTIVIVENEGNACLTTSIPRVHIVLAGIEKVTPTLGDAAVLLDLLPRSATGQRITSYVSFINGPRRQGEIHGPERVIVILLDNGRTGILRHPEKREVLYCIRCGACMNVCPVYQTVGGHAYGATYPGPIGSVLTPMLQGLESAKDLPFASSLCGACSEICPVKINIHHQLLYLRGLIVREGSPSVGERLLVQSWAMIMRSPFLYSIGSRVARLLLRSGAKIPGWSDNRDLTPVADQTFHDWWKTQGAGN